MPQAHNPTYMTPDQWTAALARRGFVVVDGVAYHGSGGQITPLPVPNWNDPGVMAMVAQALAEYGCNRIVQNAKAGEGAKDLSAAFDHGDVETTDSGDESRRVKLVEKLVRDEISAAARAKAPNISDADLEATIAKYHDAFAKRVVERGSYVVAEKKKKGAPAATGSAVEL